MPAEREVRLDALLERRDPKLLEPGDVLLQGRFVRDVGERRAAPQRQRLAQLLRGALRQPRGQRPPALLHEPLEPLGVQLADADPEQITGWAGDERAGRLRPGRERRTQARDLDLERVDRVGGGGVAPQPIDQPVGGHERVRAQQQHRQQRALPRPAEGEQPPVPADLERAEEAEPQAFALPREGHGVRAGGWDLAYDRHRVPVALDGCTRAGGVRPPGGGGGR